MLSCHAGAIWELHDLAGKARGHRANCLLLDGFLQDVMRTLDNQGRALASADSLQLAHLLELIEAAIELVDGCNKPGWCCDVCNAGQIRLLVKVTSCLLSQACLCQ